MRARGRRILLSAFGLGLVPVAPGTVGSIATAGAVLGAEVWLGAGLETAGLLFLLGSVATLLMAADAESSGSGKDPGWVVTDEVAGQAIASAAALAWGLALPALAALLLFRLFDVWKPAYIGRLGGLNRALLPGY